MLAVTVEALVEYGKSIGKAIADKQAKTAITQLCAVTLFYFIVFDIFSNASLCCLKMCCLLFFIFAQIEDHDMPLMYLYTIILRCVIVSSVPFM